VIPLSTDFIADSVLLRHKQFWRFPHSSRHELN